MATPKEALTGTVQPININQNAKAAPPNRPMANIDQVQFTNNDPTNTATVTFLGAAANAFGASSVSILPNATSDPLTPTQSNLIVDYNVAVGTARGGPYSIAVGSGPLEIDILDSTGNTNLLYAAIPNNGSLFFRNETANEDATVDFGEANVLFDNGNSVTSQSVPASSSGKVLTGRGTNKDVSYTVSMATSNTGRVMTANGSIKVGQT
jgi:hypothetical protein